MERKKIKKGDIVSYMGLHINSYFLALTDEHNGVVLGLCNDGNTQLFPINIAYEININEEKSFIRLIPDLEAIGINEKNGLLQLLNLEDDLDDDDDNDDDDEGNLWDNVKVTYEYSQPKIEIYVANI